MTNQCTVDQGCDSTDEVCAYCPGDGSQCTVLSGVTSSDVCSNLIACELPNGDIRFNMTLSECKEYPGICSGECAEPICRPTSRFRASACAVYNMSNVSLCISLMGGTAFIDSQNTCISYDLSESDCLSLNALFGAEYITCESVDVTRCNSASLNYIQMEEYPNLGCGVSEIGPCQSKESCERNGGTCSDSMWMNSGSNLTNDGDITQRKFTYGVCSVSGAPEARD